VFKKLSILTSVLFFILINSSFLFAEEKAVFDGAKPTEYPDWFKEGFLNLNEDVAEAAEKNKRLMLIFHQPGCPFCNALVERNLAQMGPAIIYSPPARWMARLLALANRTARPLASTRVGFCPLAVDRQAAPMAQTPIVAQIHEPLDVELHVLPQLSLHGEVGVDVLANLRQISLHHVLDLDIGSDPGLGKDPLRGGPADSEDIRKRELSALIVGHLYACNTSHVVLPNPGAVCDAGSRKSPEPRLCV